MTLCVQAVFYVDIVGTQVSHFQKEEMFKVGGVFNLIDISSGSAHHGHCYHGLMDICLQCFDKSISSGFPTHRSMETRGNLEGSIVYQYSQSATCSI